MNKSRLYSTTTLIFLFFLMQNLHSPAAYASGVGKYESWYQDVWCEGYDGQTEVEQDDGTRVDCLTSNHAIEMEFARKWPEAIGQSLHYSLKTGRNAGIVLILQKPSDEHYWASLNDVIKQYKLPITLWRLGP
ncbi:hypothetical protein GCM10023116_05420 [Kistimonas scapharcae]|uniref:Uncharacterized protein n=2 Tax=Kistimonas scapharcae TaxID=1036133 RepID=A0ABP8UZI5_9GAMM